MLNRRGLDRAVASGVDEVNFVVCVSDTFSRRNQNASTRDSMRAAVDVVEAARDRGIFTTITLATAFGQGRLCRWSGGRRGVYAVRSGRLFCGLDLFEGDGVAEGFELAL